MTVGTIHHLDINVSDLERSREFWRWLLVDHLGYVIYSPWPKGESYRLGDTYISIVQAEEHFVNYSYHRKKVGLNLIAFHIDSEVKINGILHGLRKRNIPILYSDRYPHAAGKENYCLFFEDPDRIKVELKLSGYNGIESKNKLTWTPPTLVTDRLILRALTMSDTPSIFSYAKNPSVARYTLWEPHQSENRAIDFIQNYATSYYQREIPEPLGIAFKDSPERIIGTVGCFAPTKEAKTMELAYALAEEQWGKGIMTEAARKVLEYCFENLSVFRIQCRCKAEHKASARVMEKIGMKYEGTLRASLYYRDHYWDMLHYSILRDEWQANRRSHQ